MKPALDACVYCSASRGKCIGGDGLSPRRCCKECDADDTAHGAPDDHWDDLITDYNEELHRRP